MYRINTCRLRAAARTRYRCRDDVHTHSTSSSGLCMLRNCGDVTPCGGAPRSGRGRVLVPRVMYPTAALTAHPTHPSHSLVGYGGVSRVKGGRSKGWRRQAGRDGAGRRAGAGDLPPARNAAACSSGRRQGRATREGEGDAQQQATEPGLTALLEKECGLPDRNRHLRHGHGTRSYKPCKSLLEPTDVQILYTGFSTTQCWDFISASSSVERPGPQFTFFNAQSVGRWWQPPRLAAAGDHAYAYARSSCGAGALVNVRFRIRVRERMYTYTRVLGHARWLLQLAVGSPLPLGTRDLQGKRSVHVDILCSRMSDTPSYRPHVSSRELSSPPHDHKPHTDTQTTYEVRHA